MEKYSTEIVANEMQFIGGRGDNPGASQGGGFASQGGQNTGYQGNAPQNAGGFGGGQPQGGFGGKPAPAPSQPAPQTGHQPANNFDDFDDDIPF